jgi:hypothetical protein
MHVPSRSKDNVTCARQDQKEKKEKNKTHTCAAERQKKKRGRDKNRNHHLTMQIERKTNKQFAFALSQFDRVYLFCSWVRLYENSKNTQKISFSF